MSWTSWSAELDDLRSGRTRGQAGPLPAGAARRDARAGRPARATDRAPARGRRLRRRPQPGAHRRPQPAGRDAGPLRGGAPRAGADRAGRRRARRGLLRAGRAARCGRVRDQSRRTGARPGRGRRGARGRVGCAAASMRRDASAPRSSAGAISTHDGLDGNHAVGAGAGGCARPRPAGRGRGPPLAPSRRPRPRGRLHGRGPGDHQVAGGGRRRGEVPRRLPP